MSPENFAYWLQGFNEIVGKAPTQEQWQVIQDHLSLVFNKVTPYYNNSPRYLGNVPVAQNHNQKKCDFVLSGNPPTELEYDFKKINISC